MVFALVPRHVWFSLFGAAVAAGSVAAAPPPPSLTDFRADLETLEQFLARDASFSAGERADAGRKLEVLRKRAANLTQAEFELAAAHIVALARNGHTMLAPGWSHRFNRIPLHCYLFADGLFVIHAPETMRDLSGAQIISLDGHAVEELKRGFARYHGGNEPKRNELICQFLESPALLHAAGFAKTPDRVSIELRLRDGTRTTRTVTAKLDPPPGHPLAFFDESRLLKLAAENTAAVPLYLAEPDEWYRLSELPELQAWYVQLRINLSVGDRKIDAFLASALETLRDAKPRNLVVDLRLNGGGDLNTTRDFMQALPSLIPDDGHIFALTAGRTFSAGIASLGYLKQAGAARVTIVGAPVGDSLEFWAEGTFMELPVSKAVLFFSTERHNYMTGCPEPDCHKSIRDHPIRIRSLEPDISAPLTHADYRAGRDPALKAVREALKQR